MRRLLWATSATSPFIFQTSPNPSTCTWRRSGGCGRLPDGMGHHWSPRRHLARRRRRQARPRLPGRRPRVARLCEYGDDLAPPRDRAAGHRARRRIYWLSLPLDYGLAGRTPSGPRRARDVTSREVSRCNVATPAAASSRGAARPGPSFFVVEEAGAAPYSATAKLGH